MITKEELNRIKQGDGLTVESNGIKHYGASEVLISYFPNYCPVCGAKVVE